LFGSFFPPFTNQFTDSYIANNTSVQQQLERVIAEPDFLFSAAEISNDDGTMPPVMRTGTTNWWCSGMPSLAGPGVIRPPIKITFNKLGPVACCVYTSDSSPNGAASVIGYHWASFDSSTNLPIVYPCGLSPGANELTVHLWLHNGSTTGTKAFTWELPVPNGGVATLQAATNLTDWVSLCSVTNRGEPLVWHHTRSLERRFFRVVPE
jgi:hypothetical protein